MNTGTEIRKPAGQGQAFKDYRGDESFPQENLETLLQNCQDKYSTLAKDILSNVPREMLNARNWVAWKLVHKDGQSKPTKVPFQPRNPHVGADTTKPEHWGSLEEALTAMVQAGLDGVGYVFTGTPHAGVDLDNCFDASGNLHPWAAEIVQTFDDCAYTEVSPSGNGLHIITEGSLSPDAWHKRKPVAKTDPDAIEMYDTGRYFTVTGKPYADFTGLEIGDGQAALDWLQAKYAKAEKPKTEKPKHEPKEQDPETVGLEDQIVIDKARQASNAEKFDALMNGDLSEHGDDHSAADMALCSILAFWTRDPAQIDRIFRLSALMRPKWDERRGRDTYGNITIQKALELAQDSGESDWNSHAGQRATMGESVWPEIIPFNELPPDLPVGLLPGILGEFSEGLAHATQTPRELAAVNVLGVVALAVQNKLIVRVKPDYSEGLNIYAIVASEPGERKSAVVSACKAPVVEYEIGQELFSMEAINEAASKRKTMERSIDKARNKAAGAKTAEERRQAADDICLMERELPEVPILPRMLVDDWTPEALAEVMAASGESLGMLEAEGGALDTLSGRYSNGMPNIDLFLKAFGAEPVIVDRKGKGPLRLRKPRLTMVLTPQPSVLRAAGSNEVFMGRGLVARCLLVMPRPLVGFRDNSQTIPPDLSNKWAKYVNGLLAIAAQANPIELTLTPEAFSLWLEFSNDVEVAQRPGGEFEFMRAWASKLTGLVVRLAGLLHMAQGLPAIHMAIGLETMRNAVMLATWAAEHAKHAYSCFGLDDGQEAAKRTLEWLIKEQRESFKKSEVFKALRGRFPKMDKILPGLEVLVDRGFLVPIGSVRPSPKGGRPAEIYAVNPALYEVPHEEGAVTEGGFGSFKRFNHRGANEELPIERKNITSNRLFQHLLKTPKTPKTLPSVDTSLELIDPRNECWWPAAELHVRAECLGDTLSVCPTCQYFINNNCVATSAPF